MLLFLNFPRHRAGLDAGHDNLKRGDASIAEPGAHPDDHKMFLAPVIKPGYARHAAVMLHAEIFALGPVRHRGHVSVP